MKTPEPTDGPASPLPGARALLVETRDMKRTTASFWAALAVLVLVGLAGFQTTTALEDTTTWVERTHEVIEALGAARLALVAATARRQGLAGDGSFLAAREQARAALQKLQALTADHPEQQRHLAVVRPLIEQRLALPAAAISGTQHDAAGATLEAEQLRTAGAIDGLIARRISQMVNAETSLLAQRRQRTAHHVLNLRVFLVAGTIASCAVLLLAFRRLRQEILARIESELVVRENEHNLATTLMSISDGVISTDTHSRITRMNRVAEQLTGWTASAALGKPVSQVFQLVHEETRSEVPDPIAAALASGAPVEIPSSTLLVRSDGSEVPIADGCAPVRDVNGELRGAVLVFRDVSEAQRAKKLKDTVQRQMIFSDRMAAVGTLAAGVAHEINNPLTYITGNLELIIEETAKRPVGAAAGAKELQAMAVEALRGAERVQKIVRGLKTFSRADEDRRVVLDVRRVLELAVSMAFNEIRHRARLVRDYHSVPLVEADEARLGQVFINLLVNAAQAIPEGGVADNEIRISTSTDRDAGAIIEIADTGSGIAAAQLDRIFDPFFTTKPVGVGTGLGLSICHSIIASIGGSIGVSSEPGRGTTFRVTLPPAPGSSIMPEQNTPVPKQTARASVLVLDDELLVASVLARMLSEHDVSVVTKAREALALIEQGKHFDVIFSDLMMPEMSGMEFYAELSRRHPAATQRVVFVTGGAFTPAAREFLDQLPNPRLDKPFNAARLRALVQELVPASMQS
jgi:PAS domain S-box-containing protein